MASSIWSVSSSWSCSSCPSSAFGRTRSWSSPPPPSFRVESLSVAVSRLGSRNPRRPGRRGDVRRPSGLRLGARASASCRPMPMPASRRRAPPFWLRSISPSSWSRASRRAATSPAGCARPGARPTRPRATSATAHWLRRVGDRRPARRGPRGFRRGRGRLRGRQGHHRHRGGRHGGCCVQSGARPAFAEADRLCDRPPSGPGPALVRRRLSRTARRKPVPTSRHRWLAHWPPA